jgi:multidrug efflux pump subunit AcrA (membrane-fusion protein)
VAEAGDLQRETELARDAIDGGNPALAGTLVACLAALFMALLGWLAWAQVDEVVQATGTVEPAGRVKVVNHPRGGRVAAIHVREGQRVEAGAVLITLDGDLARSERSETLGRLQLREVEVARLEAEAAARELPLSSAEYRPDLLASQQALLAARNSAHASRREALERAVQTRNGELRTVAADIDRLRGGVDLLGRQRRTFDYLRFGSLDGVLQKIAADATPDPRTGELTYAVTVVTSRDHLGAGPGELAVTPGMAVDVDLKVGRRTILSYLTDRIFRWREAFREV